MENISDKIFWLIRRLYTIHIEYNSWISQKLKIDLRNTNITKITSFNETANGDSKSQKY